MNRRAAQIATGVVLIAIVVIAALAYHFAPGRKRIVAASQSPVVGKAALGRRAPEFTVATNAGFFDLERGSEARISRGLRDLVSALSA